MAISVSSSICDLFKRQIHRGELKVGQSFPTIRDVAARHNLAYATAVRVVDRLICEGYIERHGRRPATVRGVPKKSLLVGVVYSANEANFKHPGAVKCLYSLTEAHLARGHRIQLLPIKDQNWSNVLDFARDLQSARNGGLLTFGRAGTGEHNEPLTIALRDYGLPLVQLEVRMNSMSEIWPLVKSNFADMGTHAVNIFHRLGRTRIGAIVGPWTQRTDPHSILLGIETRMNELGLPWDESHFDRIVRWNEQCGREAAARLLDKGEFDAILCQDDINALGALKEFKARGLTAPRDIALIGAGDLLSPEADVKMSTFDLQYSHVARQAVHLLERLADGESFPGHDVLIPPLYIPRQTCPERIPAEQCV